MKLVASNKVVRIQDDKTSVDVMTKMIELRECGKVTQKTINHFVSILRRDGFNDDQIVYIINGSFVDKISFLNTLFLGLVFGIFIS